MTSVLVFAIAFAVGCLSGIVFALWFPRRHAGKSARKPSFWPPDDKSTTVQRAMHR